MRLNHQAGNREAKAGAFRVGDEEGGEDSFHTAETRDSLDARWPPSGAGGGVGYMHQLGDAIRIKLVHQPGAMDFDGAR
jgi:hypothetical protein